MRDSANINGPRPWGTPEERDEFNQQIRNHLDGTPNWTDDVLDALSPEQAKLLEQRALRSAEQREREANLPQEIETFLAENPDFDNDGDLDQGNINGGLIASDLKLQGKDPKTATRHDFRESWRRVKRAFPGDVKIKKGYIEQQRAKTAREILEGEAFDETKAESMSMDKLREHANRQLRGW